MLCLQAAYAHGAGYCVVAFVMKVTKTRISVDVVKEGLAEDGAVSEAIGKMAEVFKHRGNIRNNVQVYFLACNW